MDYMNKKVDFLGIPVDAITKEETVNLVNEAIIEKKRINHVVINASKVVNMMKDKELFNSVVSCDIINADGQKYCMGIQISWETFTRACCRD